MTHKKLLCRMDLAIFDGEGGGASAGAGDSAGSPQGGTENVIYGKQAGPADQDEAGDSDAEFESLIKGKYKDAFGKRTQQIINQRFKENKGLEEKAAKADSYAAVIGMMSDKYGIDANDTEALSKAIQDDDSYYEDEALEKGLTVAQLKQMKSLERENNQFKKAEAERQRTARTNEIVGEWAKQGDQLKAVYPNFDFNKEMTGENGKRFSDLLRVGVDVRTAYEVIHKDEIIGGAMDYTAKQVAQKTVNDIRARGMRPQENGSSRKGAVTIRKADPSTFTKKDREEIARRVMRGERIEL